MRLDNWFQRIYYPTRQMLAHRGRQPVPERLRNLQIVPLCVFPIRRIHAQNKYRA